MNEEMNFETRSEEKPETNQVETSKGGSGVFKIGLGLAVGAVTGAAAFGAKKLKAHNEKKTIERLKKKGYKIEEPEKSEETIDEETDSEEEVLEEE